MASTPHNARRSLENLESLEKLGIIKKQGGKEKLLTIFSEWLNAPQVDIIPRSYGIIIIRKVEIDYQEVTGAIEISYFYFNGDLNTIPRIATIIIKIYTE